MGEFATTDLSLPNAEIRLQAHLGNCYANADWRPTLKVIMAAEGDAEAALQAIEPLECDAKTRSGLKIRISLCLPDIPQLEEVEAQLMGTVDTLKSRNRIFGNPPTLLELLDPPEEKEIRQGPLLEANRSDEAIMDAVHQKMAASKHDVIEVESDDEDDPTNPPVTHANAILMCQLLECAAKEYGDVEEVLAL
ncbi:hypothetical protein BS17DRAFT_850897 [Gyrodon lividus]|nr:hypothetical protein BS17DRAFT_850897 [Gyrodon lividus]